MFENLTPVQLASIVSIIVSGFIMTIGTIVPTIMEGKIGIKAVEGMARQPEASSQLRMGLIIGMALCETTNIYMLLVVLILLFANPLMAHFVGG
ncbi:MAG: ATP synthase F0 subunit C [Chloroflexi bacterium]|jgi:F-type H+-transporting ATPase subunit c|nr:ATP synthase F0 subunit C [Chloroflexota bacterium]